MTEEIFEHRVVGPLACNCYIVGDPATGHAVIIDPGGDAEHLAGTVRERSLTITAIVATHAHFDHILAAQRLRELTGAPFHLHPGDRPLLDWFQDSGAIFGGLQLPDPPEVDSAINEGDRLTAGTTELEVIHTPGHSPGSVSLLGVALFSGDTLFAGSVGRYDLPGGDGGALMASIRSKLFDLPKDLRVYPGHGPPTTLGEERRTNPFMGAASRLWIPPR
jgi:hydroxyacylglutathione hydrolase